MSIADVNTVLILGAGTSEPFRLPLGGQLVSGIARQIQKEAKDALAKDQFGEQTLVHDKLGRWARNPEDWYSHPIHGTVVAEYRDNEGNLTLQGIESAAKKLQELHGLLQNQTAETIDAFIAENPRVASTTKSAVAAMMLQSMYAKNLDNKSLTIRALDARELDVSHRGSSRIRERNWIHLLINIVRHAIDQGHVSAEKKIKIVTFNYDTILEFVLSRQFSNRETPLGPYSEYFEIHHVHGMFELLETSVRKPWSVAQSWGKKICVVKEASPTQQVLDARSRATSIISNAQHIYTIGFSFAGPNCRLLSLGGPVSSNRSLTYCNYDGNRGIAESANRNVQTSEDPQEVSGTYDRPMSVSDFIRGGYLGEPPG